MEKKSHKSGLKNSGHGWTAVSPVTSVTVSPVADIAAAVMTGGLATSGAGGNGKNRQSASGHHHSHHHHHHHNHGHHSSHNQSSSTVTTASLATTKANNNNTNDATINTHSNTKPISTSKVCNAMAAINTTHNSPNAISANYDVLSKTRNKNEEAINDLRQRIPEIENIFDVHSRIGNGTFSTVLLGTLKKERDMPESMRRKFAIKHHIPTSHPDRIMKELQCMAKIGGTDNVVGINCCIRYNESVAFIMPYMAHDRFHDFFNKMDLSELQHYMKNLLIALRHVHKFNVIHRDVKPSNFLYNRRKRQFLLVDFGLAQQVPTALLTGALEGGANELQGGGGALTMSEGKRSRELGGESATGSKNSESPNALSGEVTGTAKRLRCTGPQGDQQVPAGGAGNGQPNARGANSCIVSGAQFKMPLKQLNEISTNGKMTLTGGIGGGVGGGSGATLGITTSQMTNNGIYEQPLDRPAKSVILGTSTQNRSHRLRSHNSIRSPNNSNTAALQMSAVSGMNAGNAEAADNTNTSNKYNTSRNLSTASGGAKCFCYGNPQVCNICLIKKEIHASRAGTPGYRPPEVLLKYPDQTTAVDVWAAGVIFLSILSSVYPFFKAPNDFVALAEMVTIFGDKTIRKTAFILDRLVTLSQKTKPLDLRKLCVRFRNRIKFSSPELLKKYQRSDGSCEVCKNCDQFYFNCLCSDSNYNTEPLDNDDPFPASAYDLLCKLLEVNPHKRITAEEALRHPFFSEGNNKKSLNNTTSATISSKGTTTSIPTSTSTSTPTPAVAVATTTTTTTMKED